MKHFIATDRNEYAIYGIGTTRAEAAKDAAEQGHLNGKTSADFIVHPASQELIREVEESSGAIAWDYDENGLAIPLADS